MPLACKIHCFTDLVCFVRFFSFFSGNIWSNLGGNIMFIKNSQHTGDVQYKLVKRRLEHGA